MTIKEKISLHKALQTLRVLLRGRHFARGHHRELGDCGYDCKDDYERLRDAEKVLESQ